MSAISDYLREARERTGLSVAAVAKTARISAPYLYQIEDGRRNASAKILGRLAQAYKIRTEELLTKAGLLPDAVLADNQAESQDAKVLRAFEYVMTDPAVRAGSEAMETLPIEAKLAIVRLYERAEGLRILPDDVI